MVWFMSTELLDRPQTSDPDLDSEDRVAHLIAGADKVTTAYIEGTPVEALCGQVFVPSRDPEQYPVCQGCTDIAKEITG